MSKFAVLWIPVYFVAVVCAVPTTGRSDDTHSAHQHGDAKSAPVEAPTVFLDKSPRIVEYQLKRLDDTRLLMVPRQTDDPKYKPVYQAILGRSGMSPQYRIESVEALAKIDGTSQAAVLLDAIKSIKLDGRESQRTLDALTRMLLTQEPASLQSIADDLESVAADDSPEHASVAFAALTVAGLSDQAMTIADASDESNIAWANSIKLLPKADQRNASRDRLIRLIDSSESQSVSSAAIAALGELNDDPAANFAKLAPLVASDTLRNSAVRSLLRLPRGTADGALCQSTAEFLVGLAEKTPPADRTTDEFVDAMQLVDRLLAKVPADVAKTYRGRLNEVTVRVIKIRTVEEEMRYDVPYFAVEAGRPVQIVLENHDLMPHNLVITQPGKLKEVANAGLNVGPEGTNGLAYVPDSDDVIAATPMIQPDEVTRLTIDAPTEPGEYPYVCTFPQHWYRMYGVMVVVSDLEQWNKAPVEPKNPIGSNRAFVQAWTVDDLEDDIEAGLRGSTPAIGQKLFVEASCAGCHKIAGKGGVVGPELTDLWPRWKGDSVGILREILDPSHKIDPKYAMHLVLTVDGKTVSGILVKEDDEAVSLLTNPESKEPTVIAQDDIDDMVKSSTSMMPKALLDQYSKGEILELMGYLKSVAK
ncbi:c-type cytochrome [Stieleria varia]|uniref:Auracyanin-A n=1 Tax=Stieleria varia TaxID=2528005 RepID=A0A5C6ATD5_9BACT|nr:c-type cytochrome [Stieleria varia]TWU02828.1 Auracyanin-A precursor [Stieleria varia]